MNSGKINEWLQLVTAAAVLVGLFLVVHEIRQNNAVARAATLNDLYAGWEEFSVSEFESDILDLFIKSIERPHDLTSVEVAKLNSYYVALTSLYSRWWTMYRDHGYANDPTVDTAHHAQYYFGSRFARSWIRQNRPWLEVTSPDMVELIIRELESNPPITEFRHISGFDPAAPAED